MKELLVIITIGALLFGIACAAYEVYTQWHTRRKLDRFAAAQRRVTEDLRRAAK